MRQLYRNLLGMSTGLAIIGGTGVLEKHIADYYEIQKMYRSFLETATNLSSILIAGYAMEIVSPRSIVNPEKNFHETGFTYSSQGDNTQIDSLENYKRS